MRNRDLWTVTVTDPDGALTVSHLGGHGTIALPADYVQQHVLLCYAATEHGHQGDTVDVGIALVSTATTHRALYVGVTRGRDDDGAPRRLRGERRVCKDGRGQKSWVHESVSSTRWGMLQAGLSTIVLV